MRSPGDIVVSNFGMGGKTRPWLVLWVDDTQQIACVIAVTSQTGYPGALCIGPSRYGCVGAWATIQPLVLVERAKHTGVTMKKSDRRRISEHLHKTLAFVED